MLQQNTSVRSPRCAPQARHSVSMRASVCAARDERLGIEAAIAPRNVLVVDVVLDAEVVERRQPAELDAARDVGAIRDEVVEQAEDVRGVGAVRRRRQAEQEAGIDAIEDPPVRLGGGVVHLVDDDVVEAARSRSRARFSGRASFATDANTRSAERSLASPTNQPTRAACPAARSSRR